MNIKLPIPKEQNPSLTLKVGSSSNRGSISFETSSLIQSRSLGFRESESFGSDINVYNIGHESILPSASKKTILKPYFQIRIGGKDCKQPYDASIYNASALSYGPLSKNFILALNKAAAMQSFYQNTGEAGLSPYHLGFDVALNNKEFNLEDYYDSLLELNHLQWINSGDTVWEIGTGYFGCRNKEGGVDRTLFKRRALIPNVKMIEIKISQGMEPSKSIPMTAIPMSVYKVLGVEDNQKVVLPNKHKEFNTPLDLLYFIKELRTLANGKPVGIKFSLGSKVKFLAICKAIIKTGIAPDFISLDGMEGGAAVSTKGVAGFVGIPLDDALVYVHNTLNAIGMRKSIKIIASGRIFSEKDMVCKLARGADLFATGRGMILAGGCNQQRECHKGNCLQGIATQNRDLEKRLNIESTAKKIAQFHKITMLELSDILSAAGLSHPTEVRPEHLLKRTSLTELKPLNQAYYFAKKGSLLTKIPWLIPEYFREDWKKANFNEEL